MNAETVAQFVPGLVVLAVLLGAGVAAILNRRNATRQPSTAAPVTAPSREGVGRGDVAASRMEWNVLLDGMGACIVRAETRPPRAVLQLRDPLHWQFAEGHYLVLTWPGGHSTRYRIDKLRRPAGICFAECTFAPRGGA